MKKITLLITALVLLVNVTAQEMGFNYKALVSDASGSPISNATGVWIQFAILQDGDIIYQEAYNDETTDANGILITNIGEGVASIGTFSEIDWALEYSLRVSIEAGSGVSVYTPTPFKAVPYAKYADYGKDEDADPNNEIQTLSFDGTSLHLTDGGTVDLSPLAGTGTDDQALTLAGNTLTLEDGGTVNLSPYLDNTDTQLTETQVDNYVSDNGYITTEVDGSITNEIQTLSTSGTTVSLSNGGGTIGLPVSGKIVNSYFISGFGSSPDPDNPNYQFVAEPLSITITEVGQQVMVSSSKALGAGDVPATGLKLAIGYQGSSDTDPIIAGFAVWGLQVPASTRIPMSLNAIISNLLPGTYQIGLVSKDGTGWNNNEYSYTSAIVFSSIE